MEKHKFRDEDVIYYLEQLILDNLADENEQTLYEEYIWNGSFNNLHIVNKLKYTYMSLVKKMRLVY